MDTNQRKNLYKSHVINTSDKTEMKVSTISRGKSCNYAYEFLCLTNLIPDYKLYLNPKQAQIASMFVSSKDIQLVATLLNKPYGSIYCALFGASNLTEQGIYGRLKRAFYKLSGERSNVSIESVLLKHSQLVEKERKLAIERDIKNELFWYVMSTPDWKSYLTSKQTRALELYIEHKSISKVDEILGVQSCWGLLYGKTKIDMGGAFARLERQYNKKSLSTHIV